MRYKTRRTITSLDILLLTYNNLENTKRCIKALYDNTLNFSLTILDNASTDGTIDYLKDIATFNMNITLELQDENLGIVKGRNYLYKISNKISPSTDYIMFLDNDQFVNANWKEVYLQFMKEGYDIVGSEAWQMDRRRCIPKKKCVRLTEEFNYVGCGGMMIKHHVIKDIGLFDEQFAPMYFEDPDFCYRAFEAGYRIIWRPYFIDHQPHKLLKKELNVDRLTIYFDSHKKFVKKHGSTFFPVLRIPPKSLQNLSHAKVL